MELKKRIIFTVTNDLSYDQRMIKICRSLASAGYLVELVGRQRSSSVSLATEPFKQTRLKCLFNKGKLFYLEFNFRLFWYLLFAKADAVCAIDLDTIVAAYLAVKLKKGNVKLAYDAHEYFTEVPEVTRRPTVRKVWLWVEKTFVPKVNLAYTVSESIADLLSQKYRRPFGVIMNAPLLLPQGSNKLQPPFILYQGALNEGRGLEHLIETMQFVNARLKLAGEGDLSEQLRQLVKNYGVEDKVDFLGLITPAKLRVLTAGASIGMNILENNGLSYYYSLANKFFDYIHAGVPQICIDFPEYRRLNNKYEVALLVKDCSVHEIKTAIERLLNDHEYYRLLQKKCEVCSQQLNWQQEEKKLLNFYHELLR